MEPKLVYMTAASEDEAIRLARMLVAERLAACVNILGQMRSVFRWEGEVRDDAEIAFVAKTTSDRLDQLVARVTEAHLYDCPCVVALPITGGHSDFLSWIGAETRPA